MKNDNYCLLKHNRLVSSLWGKNRRGPSKLSALQVEEWKKKIQFNAPLGAKRFSKCLFTSFFSRIFLASAVPEKKDFELYFNFFFWHRWSLAWNHNFPMNVKKKKNQNKRNLREWERWVALHKTYGLWLCSCCFVTEFVEPRLPLKWKRFFWCFTLLFRNGLCLPFMRCFLLTCELRKCGYIKSFPQSLSPWQTNTTKMSWRIRNEKQIKK